MNGEARTNDTLITVLITFENFPKYDEEPLTEKELKAGLTAAIQSVN